MIISVVLQVMAHKHIGLNRGTITWKKQEGERVRPVGLRAVSLGCDNGVSVQIRGEVVLGKT